jgi:hypothetical protein
LGLVFCSQYHQCCLHSFRYGFCTLVGKHFAKPMYVFFVPNLEKFQEFYKLMGLLNTKGNKLCRNMKTIWISMLFPTKWVFVEYHLLIVKLHVENANNNATSRSIWIIFVMLISLKGCFVSSLCSNVCIHLSRLHKAKIYLCVNCWFYQVDSTKGLHGILCWSLYQIWGSNIRWSQWTIKTFTKALCHTKSKLWILF